MTKLIKKWLKYKDGVNKLKAENRNLSRKGKLSELHDLKQALYDWFVLKSGQKTEIGGDFLIKKANCFTDEFYGGLGNFKGWL